ncbi:MAG: WYL domain-containing protein [Anaerolineae bacterium]|nr:WYL domain-containing protein [Anaerolineae bacterium]
MNHPFDPDQPLNETTFAIFDVETTGLSPTYGHRICEVACLRVRGGVVLDRFESLVDPQRSISPGAFSVNRITPEMLRGAPTFDQVITSLLQVMDGAVLIAHNAPFDLSFLAAELEIARRPLPENPVIDTLTLVRRLYNFAHNNLSAVAEALNLEITPTHRALGDVWTTFGLWERLRHDLERRWSITTLGEVLAFQGGSIAYPRSYDLPLPPTISEALKKGGRVRMRYVDANGWETERVIRPLRVSEERGNLYLVAHCYYRDALRTFRLDRVVEMVLEEQEEDAGDLDG